MAAITKCISLQISEYDADSPLFHDTSFHFSQSGINTTIKIDVSGFGAWWEHDLPEPAFIRLSCNGSSYDRRGWTFDNCSR